MTIHPKYAEAIASQDWKGAESILREAVNSTSDLQAVFTLGEFLRSRGRLAEADAFLSEVTSRSPTESLLQLLANIQYQRRSFNECERTLERLVSIVPTTSLGNYRLLAKLKGGRLGQESMREVMASAREAHPGDIEFLLAYTDCLPAEEGIAILEQQLEGVRIYPALVAHLLQRITTYRGPLLRRQRGLPLHGVSWPDTLQWPDPDHLPALKAALESEIAVGSPRAQARLELGHIAIAGREWDTAERYFTELRNGPKRTSADFFAIGPDFHAALDRMTDSEIVGSLCSVERLLVPAARAETTIFMASDPKYFGNFTLPFLQQLDEQQIPVDLHVHILDGDDAAWKGIAADISKLRILNITLTAEASGVAGRGKIYARNYYHSIRYVRLYEEICRTKRPMWILDCDVQLLSDPRPLLSRLRSCDLAVRSSPCATDPVVKFTASMVGVAPTGLGLEFLRRVAAAIIHWKNRGSWNWGVDQMAIFSAYAHMADQGREPRTLFLADNDMSDRDGHTGTVRFLSGIAKFIG